MEFLKDQELFKDLRDDGTLPSYIRHDCSIGACAVFKQAVKEYHGRMSGEYKVNYRSSYERDPSQSEFQSSVNVYANRAFTQGYHAIMDYVAEAEEIGSFPIRKIYLATLSVEDLEPIDLEVDVKRHISSAEIPGLQGLAQKGSKALETRHAASKSRKAAFFVLLHLLVLAYCSATVLMPNLGLPILFDGWLQNLLVVSGAMLLLFIGVMFHMEDSMLPLLTGINGFFSFYLLLNLCTRPEYEYQDINAAVAMGLTAITLARYLWDGLGGYNLSVQREFVNEFDEKAQTLWRQIRFHSLWEKEVWERESAQEGKNEETLRDLAKIRKKYR